MSNGGEAGYFVRMNGKSLGPFSVSQLQSFREKGRLRPEHELSTDREKWFAAGRVPELFAPAESPATYGFSRDEPAAAPSTETEWYVEIDGERRGPLSQARIRGLIASGKVAEDDLIWKTGLPDWQPAEDFRELFDAGPDRPASSKSRRRAKGDDRHGLWTPVLESVRNAVSEDDLEWICRSMLVLGRVSMLVGAVGVASFLACEAVVRNSLATAGYAALMAFVLFALQYVGQRMGSAAHGLATASAYRLSSTAFPYSLAVILVALGVFFAASGVLSQIGRVGDRSPIDGGSNDVIPIAISLVVGVEILLPFLFAFHAALHPAWSNVDCSSTVCAGEEGIGCIAYLLKIGLRFAPVIYGVSATLGALGSIAAVALYASGEALRRDSYDVLLASLMSLVAAAVAPLSWYFSAAIGSAILDIIAPSLRASSTHSA